MAVSQLIKSGALLEFPTVIYVGLVRNIEVEVGLSQLRASCEGRLEMEPASCTVPAVLSAHGSVRVYIQLMLICFYSMHGSRVFNYC
jgi:hypothetical protein